MTLIPSADRTAATTPANGAARRARRRRSLVVLAVLLVLASVLASGCGGRAQPAAMAPPATVSPSASSTPPAPSPTPSPTPTPKAPAPQPPPPRAPLTGARAPEPAALGRPVLAVKVDNTKPARPQSGLDVADVVFEELVEGGATRFVALFHSADPGVVGPVRSGRDVDAHLLPAFSPALALAGAAPPTMQVLRAAGLRLLDEGPGSPLFRDGSRRAPYNLYLDAPAAWRASGGLPAAAPAWPFERRIPPGGQLVRGVSVAFSRQAGVAWEWDADEGVWRRSDHAGAHVLSSGAQVTAENVVVVRVPVREGSGVDVNGARTKDITVIGTGAAVVLRDGVAFEGSWHKAAPEAQFEWRDAAGRPLPLAPGRTWIALVPVGAPVQLVPPA